MPYKYFFSPQPTTQTKNEFIDHFYDTLARNVVVINYEKKAISRSVDYFRYSFRTNVMILNWPEDIIHLRFGIIQLFFSFFVLAFFKLKGGKIVWICHNKESHKKNYKLLRNMTRSFYTKISDLIVVLSSDALNHFSKVKEKVSFLNHPVYMTPGLIEKHNNEEQTDVLIWGNISPYKGLSEFIESYRSHNNIFKVKIIGHSEKAYLKILTEKATGLNIEIVDRFLSKEELVHQFENSKIILLPYKDIDTFSSGALVHSLCSNKIIIGPAIGNFIDLKQVNACLVYNSYPQLFILINSLLNNKYYYDEELEKLRKGILQYYNNNTWENFVRQLVSLVTKNNQKNFINKKYTKSLISKLV